ncbi:MAG: ATP synthase F1 subunit epsilon [Deltaproteobacteria bacterium]|nr:MAG: ATP synthase F1 subunit epsilon [Deltaproteobacteria bacterium]
MAEVLRLRVYTRERQLVDQDVREVTAPGVYGEIGVLPDHAALVTTLEPGVLSYKDTAGAVASVQVTGGFAEVRDNVMTVLADAGAAAAG